MKTAYDIAQFFLYHAYNGEKDYISNLKLQKLLYYAQGYSLAILDKPLFDEPIECWPHGPVVSSVYHCYKHYYKSPILVEGLFDASIFDEDTLTILDRVACDYGQYTPWKLRNMTHEEMPWQQASLNHCSVISNQDIKQFFKEKLNMTHVRDDRHAYCYDIDAMQASIDSGALPVPSINNDEEFLTWLNG
ncbi:Panacea domain-containing protein [Psychrobacter sp. H7-1]|uniref:Panacea domain-containing protein n=1 Tax=Psychrobacter sp. H7-1 TaxID=1569265 RepID=UPI00191A4F62|nr:type II toxin-antitoxin system antitoxin SocA domain-containing protein [Psychrobacter sp. H7-1]